MMSYPDVGATAGKDFLATTGLSSGAAVGSRAGSTGVIGWLSVDSIRP